MKIDKHIDKNSEYYYLLENKNENILIGDENEYLIYNIKEKLALIIEDDLIAENVISAMIKNGNKIYNSIKDIPK